MDLRNWILAVWVTLQFKLIFSQPHTQSQVSTNTVEFGGLESKVRYINENSNKKLLNIMI